VKLYHSVPNSPAIKAFSVHCTAFLALPRDNLDPGDLGASSKVNHPRRSVDVVVVEDGAAVHAGRDVTVDGSRRVATDPLTADVPLVLALVVDPRTLLKRYVLH